MKQILAIALAGFVVHFGFAGDTMSATGNSRLTEVPAKISVTTSLSRHENLHLDPSFLGRSKRFTETAMKVMAFKLYPYSRHEAWMKREIVRVTDGLIGTVTTHGSRLLDSGENELKVWIERASDVSADIAGPTKSIVYVATEILADQLLDLNRLTSVNAPVSGDEVEISRWLGERAIAPRAKG